MMSQAIPERNKLKAEVEKLRRKVEQLKRFEECFVSHPGEGTLECDISKPCPFCRSQHASLQLGELREVLRWAESHWDHDALILQKLRAVLRESGSGKH